MADVSEVYGTLGEQNRPSPEKRLLDQLDRMRSNTANAFAVHLHLSDLRPSHRQPHFIRMVERALDSLAQQQDVQVFTFSNADVALLCRNTPVDDVDDAVFRVRTLFNEDPLTMSEDGSADDRFSTWYDLAQVGDFKDFEDHVKVINAARKEAREKPPEALTTGRASKTMEGQPLEPKMLDAIQQKLLEVRIADMVHRQPAVLVQAGRKQELSFHEHFIAMGELRKRIAPNINIFSSHWLFQYLSQTIDARVLEVVSRFDYSRMDTPISINLNISTIAARPFQNFHAIVGDNTDKVIIEIQAIDVFADMGLYAETRDWLRENGYRVLIDGLNPLTLDFFDASLLDADMIKITWGPEVRGGLTQEPTENIRNTISKLPRGAVVLTRVDTEEGVSWGLEMGILCFQGYFIDKVVHAMAQKGMLQ